MECDCIIKIEEQLKKHTGDPDAKLMVTFMLIKGKMVQTIPAYAEYRTKKVNGGLTKRISKEPVLATHCPFCGKKQYDF